MSILDKFKIGLEKSRKNLNFGEVFIGKEIDDDFFDDLEEKLILADVGGETAFQIIEELKEETSSMGIKEDYKVKNLLVKKMLKLLDYGNEVTEELPKEGPLVILVIGVNGSGKTTTIGKIAQRWKKKNKNVMMVAGDTFRAAAIDQLEIWSQRVGAEIVKQQPGSDPSSVYYDALQAAPSRNIDVVIGDTAGRLHTKVNLMDELSKIHRVIGRVTPGAPHEVLLVIDACTGQNGLSQALKFNEAVPFTGVVLTKLDGTARGGIAIAIREQLKLPIKYVGLGEKLEDLEVFSPELFANAIVD